MNVPSPVSDEELTRKMRALGHLLYHRYSFNFSQKKILQVLLRQGSMTQKELTCVMDIKPGSLCEVLAKVEAGGWISRTRDPEDRRGYAVSLTPKGREEALACEQKRADTAQFLFSVLNEEEKETLNNILEKLYDHWNGAQNAQMEEQTHA